MDLVNGLSEMVLVALAKLIHAILPVKSLSDHFVSLDKLVNLPGQLIILFANDADVVVHAVNLHLQVGIVLQQGGVRVPRTLQLFPHIHQLVLLLADLHLKLFDRSRQFNILTTLRVDASLQILVLLLVTLLQLLQVVQLVDEIVHLCFQIGDLSVSLTQVHLLALQVHRLRVDQPIQLLHLVEHLADLELKTPNVTRQVLPFRLLQVTC